MKEIYIKDKVESIAGPNEEEFPYGSIDSLRIELQEAKAALNGVYDSLVRSIFKKADSAFKEASDDFLRELDIRGMLREGDSELFMHLQDKFLLTLIRKLKD